MPRAHFSDPDGSWIDVADSDQETDFQQSATSNQSRSKSAATSSIQPPRRVSRRMASSKVQSPYSSGFIMPMLEREVPSASKPRKRRLDASSSGSERILKPKQQAIPKQKLALAEGVVKVLTTTLSWIFEVLLGSLQVIKTPLTYALGLYLLFGMLIIASNAVTSRLSAALTPVCRLPGSTYLFPTLCESPIKFGFDSDTAVEPEFDNLMQVQQKFEDLLHQSVDYYAVPAFMKHSQSAMRDVREVVRYSTLKSKNELMLEFDAFINAASQASWDLETFNSHIGRTVDRIMLTAQWTQRTLDQISSPNATRGLIGKAVDALMAPFQPVKYTEDTVLDLYIKHSDEVQQEIGDLLTEAQAVFSLLRSLEDTIDAIHGVTARDTYYTNLGRDEVLAELWSRLGGNRKQKAMFNSQLKVLKQISTYGQAAYTNIGGAILKLQTMSAEIDQLKERLMSVEPDSGKPNIPLSVHLENIRLGVERLEEARAFARDARLEKSRAVIGAGRQAFGDDAHIAATPRAGLPRS